MSVLFTIQSDPEAEKMGHLLMDRIHSTLGSIFTALFISTHFKFVAARELVINVLST